MRRTKAGRTYRPLTRFEDLRHPTRDHRVAQARLDAELRKAEASVVMGDDITFGQLSEFYLEDGEKSGRRSQEPLDLAHRPHGKPKVASNGDLQAFRS